MEVAVLIPAAGSGARMGGEPKQFRKLGDRSLVVQSLLAFGSHPGIAHIVVAAPGDRADALGRELGSAGIAKPVTVVVGSETRQDSVAAALREVSPSADVILVHDAVRPFVSAEAISAVIQAVAEHGAAALAIPATDTLRRADDGYFGETVNRAGLYRMQTPQGFRRDLFEEAHREAARRGLCATDDVALVMELGHAVHIVEGNTSNFKITTSADWEMAQLYWPYWCEAFKQAECE